MNDLASIIAGRIAMTDSGCHEWLGCHSRGYAQIKIRGRMYKAHRVVYEMAYGPIPAGLQLDHLCRNPGCVNVDHLEPVSPRENTLRGNGPAGINARRTECSHGHAFTPQNTYVDADGHRSCRMCARLKSRRARLALRLERAS